MIVEAIKEGEIVRVSERQAREEDLFILREIKETSESKGDKGDKFEEYKKDFKREVPNVETWRKEVYERNNVLALLKDNFHWEIVKTRRARGLTRKQFAEKIGESEGDLKVVENGGLLEDNLILINKIERELGISLRKERPVESVTLAELQKMDEEKVRKEISKAHGTDGDFEGLFGKDIEVEEDL